MKKRKAANGGAERRFLVQEFRVSDGDTPSIAGYGAVFDSPSEDFGGWREEIDPHAFDNVLAANPDCRALFNHDPSLILGRTTAGTLSLSIDARGLAYVISPPETQVARDLIVSMRRKDITQSSFGFICKRDQWTENADGTVTRRILEFEELLDVSPVTYPAYTAASSGVRSIPGSMPAELRSKISQRDDSDGEEMDCDCECPECQAGNCPDCSNPDCDDPECRCGMRAKRAMKREMEMRLAIATFNSR